MYILTGTITKVPTYVLRHAIVLLRTLSNLLFSLCGSGVYAPQATSSTAPLLLAALRPAFLQTLKQGSSARRPDASADAHGVTCYPAA